MTIPSYQEIMKPLLEVCKQRDSNSMGELSDILADKFSLTEDEIMTKLESGAYRFYNRVGWARTYLYKAKLVDYPGTGMTKITKRGLEALNTANVIDNKYLEKYAEFVEFKNKKNNRLSDREEFKNETEEVTPLEKIDNGVEELKNTLISDLRNELSKVNPYYFEKIVADLLNAMNYGECNVTKKSTDKGIDGIVNQDKLGMSKIYFQAKRYNSKVPASEIRDFIGSLDAQGANKGIFITTNELPSNTESITGKSSKKIRFIDGDELAELMIEYDIGVSTAKIYKIKRVDSDYFIEE